MGKAAQNQGFNCEYCGAVVTPLTNGSYRNHCELPRPECMPSMLGRLARRGEDAELQQGDQGAGGPAGA